MRNAFCIQFIFKGMDALVKQDMDSDERQRYEI